MHLDPKDSKSTYYRGICTSQEMDPAYLSIKRCRKREKKKWYTYVCVCMRECIYDRQVHMCVYVEV